MNKSCLICQVFLLHPMCIQIKNHQQIIDNNQEIENELIENDYVQDEENIVVGNALKGEDLFADDGQLFENIGNYYNILY